MGAWREQPTRAGTTAGAPLGGAGGDRCGRPAGVGRRRRLGRRRLPLRAGGLPGGGTRPAGPPAARRRGGCARRPGAAQGGGGRGGYHPARPELARAHLGFDPRPRAVRSGCRGHRPGAGESLLPLRGGSGARGRRGLLRRGLLRPFARDRERRPVLARARLFAGVPGAGEPTGSPRIFVSHGTRDGWLPIDSCSRRIVPQLERVGYEVRYLEFEGGHVVPPAIAREAASWFAGED
jgi:hypothetical protein